MTRLLKVLAVTLVFVSMSASSVFAAPQIQEGSLTTNKQSRSFDMGFSSWPYDMSLEAINWVYEKAGQYGDLIEQHLEEGVPWPEALNDQAFPKDFQDSLDLRKAQRLPGQKLLLSISPLSGMRDSLASYRGDKINLELPSPWNRYPLDHPDVKQAYLKYARRLIKFFSPDYFCIGVEVNLLKRNKPDLWPAYLDLHAFVYSELKKEFPDLGILVSVDAGPLLEGYTDADHGIQVQALKDILPYIDILGISLHPFTTKHLADNIPDDMFAQIRRFTDKPMGVTETSYPAQEFSMRINGQDVVFKGTEDKQAEYLRQLLRAAREDRYLFVSWFTIRDYDALWEKMGKGDLMLVWRDTGLFDENGRPRKALHIWEEGFR